MGLDIVAYSKLEKESKKEIKEVLDKMLSNRFGDEVIEVREGDDIGRAQDLTPGSWLKTNETEEHYFRAGSYSTYNQFRNHLSEALLGVPASSVWEDETSFEGKPGYEMINFSDCSGVIGWTEAQKLHNDLVVNREKFRDYLYEFYDVDQQSEIEAETHMVDYMMGVYKNFILAFDYAKENGIVIYY